MKRMILILHAFTFFKCELKTTLFHTFKLNVTSQLLAHSGIRIQTHFVLSFLYGILLLKFYFISYSENKNEFS